jgi:hypothetical protein
MLDIATTRRALLGAFVLLAVVSGSARLAGATVQNQSICSAAFNQMAPSAVSNGAGGALMAWADLRSGDMDIFAQETNSFGEPQWTADGIPVCKVSGTQQFPKIVADGVGGAIVVWQDLRGPDQNIYAQRLNGNGSIVWTAGGVPVCLASGTQEFPQIVADGLGGALIAWVDRRGADADIYAQHLDASGNATWATDGIPVCAATGDQTELSLSSDGWGGAIALWKDKRSGSMDIFAQRVNSAGTPQWTPDGAPVCSAANDQQSPIGISDGAGGVIAAWSDHRGADWDIYTQRLDGTGTPAWTLDGVGASMATGDQTAPRICTDGAGGAILAWEDRRGADSDIYGQRVNVSGSPVWAANGAAICNAPSDQVSPAIVADDIGGALISWSDGRTPGNGTDVYAQKVNGATGAPAWLANGVVLCDTLGNQDSPAVVHDGEGGMIVAWRDFRPGPTSDVFSQHVDAGGLLHGNCPDTILSLAANTIITATSTYNYYNVPVPITFYWSGVGVRSAPGSDWDVEWYNSFSYQQAAAPVCFANPMAGSNTSGRVDFTVVSFETNRTPSNTVYGARVSRFAGTGNGTVEWDLKGVSITKDGSGVSSGSNWTQVMDVYDVRLVAGTTYTFDLTKTGSADIKMLLFTSNGQNGPYAAGRPEAVFETGDRYVVYTAPVTEWFGVVLVNDNGLAGTYNVKVHTGVPVGVEGGPTPKESKLMAVAPNPARGQTSFRFALAKAGDVSFRVLDMAGRQVSTLATQRWQPGSWNVQWDGRGSDGREVSAGVYFVQMQLDGRPLGQQRLALVR